MNKDRVRDTRPVYLFVAAAIVAAAAIRPGFADDSPATFNSIDELWAGFDPHALPFEIETIKAWDEDGIHLGA